MAEIGALGAGMAWGWSLAGLARTGHMAVVAAVAWAALVALVALVAALAGAGAAVALLSGAALGGGVHLAWRGWLLRRFGAAPAPGQVR